MATTQAQALHVFFLALGGISGPARLMRVGGRGTVVGRLAGACRFVGSWILLGALAQGPNSANRSILGSLCLGALL